MRKEAERAQELEAKLHKMEEEAGKARELQGKVERLQEQAERASELEREASRAKEMERRVEEVTGELQALREREHGESEEQRRRREELEEELRQEAERRTEAESALQAREESARMLQTRLNKEQQAREKAEKDASEQAREAHEEAQSLRHELEEREEEARRLQERVDDAESSLDTATRQLREKDDALSYASEVRSFILLFFSLLSFCFFFFFNLKCCGQGSVKGCCVGRRWRGSSRAIRTKWPPSKRNATTQRSMPPTVSTKPPRLKPRSLKPRSNSNSVKRRLNRPAMTSPRPFASVMRPASVPPPSRPKCGSYLPSLTAVRQYRPKSSPNSLTPFRISPPRHASPLPNGRVFAVPLRCAMADESESCMGSPRDFGIEPREGKGRASVKSIELNEADALIVVDVQNDFCSNG